MGAPAGRLQGLGVTGGEATWKKEMDPITNPGDAQETRESKFMSWMIVTSDVVPCGISRFIWSLKQTQEYSLRQVDLPSEKE